MTIATAQKPMFTPSFSTSPDGAVTHEPDSERLLNARQVAARLGVSERFIRDHTTRRSPRIPGVKLGKLLRYRAADVEIFMAQLSASASIRRP